MEEVKEELKEFKFELGEIKGCPHHFVRMGLNVECTKCGLGFFDPEMNFPLEEANKKFILQTTEHSKSPNT